MYVELASKLAVTDGSDAISPAVSMEGNNTVQFDCTIFNLGGATSLTAALEGSSDGQNWSNVASYAGLVYGYGAPSKTTGVGFGNIRIRYTVVGAGTIVLAAGVNLSFQ